MSIYKEKGTGSIEYNSSVIHHDGESSLLTYQITIV